VVHDENVGSDEPLTQKVSWSPIKALRFAYETQECRHCHLTGTLKHPAISNSGLIARACSACKRITIVEQDQFFKDAIRRSTA